MATIDKYKIKIEVDGKEKVVDTQKAVDDLTDKIVTFGQVGAAALTALTVSAARMADEMVDLGEAFGYTAGQIYQMSSAAQTAGGDFSQIEGMLSKFANTVQGAVEGNDALRQSFEKLGVGKQELEQLSDEQLFQTAVDGLANMKDGVEKTALAIDIFGKKAASLDFKTFAAEMSKAGDPAIERALENAAAAVESVEVAYRNLQVAALQAFAPILEMIGQFEIDLNGAQKAIQVLGALVAAAFAAGTVAAIAKMVTVVRTLASTIRAAATAQALLTGLIPGVGTATVIAAIAGATAAYVGLGLAMDDAVDSAEELNNMTGTVQRERPFVGPPVLPGQGRSVDSTGAERAFETAKRVTSELNNQFDAANRLYQLKINMLGQDRDAADLASQLAQINMDAESKVLDLEGQIAEERAKGAQTNQGIINQLNEQKSLVEQQRGELQALTNAEYERTQELRKQLEYLEDSRNMYSFAADMGAKNVALEYQLGAAMGQRFDKTLEMRQAEITWLKDVAELEREKGIAIENDNQRAADRIQELINLRTSQHNLTMVQMRDEEAQRLKILNSEKAGVISAMDQLQQQFTPFQMAQDATLTAWNNIGSAIDSVAKGGKASFKDMARNIISDLGAMIAKAMVFKAIQSAFAAGGITLPGLATGGPAAAGQPYIVGEKGPELFVPKSAGTVIPNNKLNSGASQSAAPASAGNVTNNYNSYNISAVDAKSVAQLFYENRKTMLGTMNIAQKELPYSMT